MTTNLHIKMRGEANTCLTMCIKGGLIRITVIVSAVERLFILPANL